MAKPGFEVIVSRHAERELRNLTRRNPALARAFDHCFQALAGDPMPEGVEKIAVPAKLKRGPRTGIPLKCPRRVDVWRVRVAGNCCAVYTILDDMILVVIARVGDRKQVCEDIGDVAL